jgi:hypothetical protein
MPSAVNARAKLQAEKEVQNWGKSFGIPTPDATSPNMCIAASKFLVARLAGLFPESAGHLNDFLSSRQAKALAPGIGLEAHKALWGDPSHAFDADVVSRFNQLVIPALLDWGGMKRGRAIKFVALRNAPTHKGDELLAGGVPMVVGVFHGEGRFRGVASNNHYVAIVKGGSKDVWVVDSWGSDPVGGVKRIDPIVGFSFGIPLTLNMSVNGADGWTVLPGKNAFFGYYEEDGAPMKLAVAL